MRFLTISLIAITLFGSDISIKGNIGAEYKKYFNTLSSKTDTQKATTASLELEKEVTNGKVFVKIEALSDSDDTNREYVMINELYYKYFGDSYEITIGKSIKFWGALELFNPADIFNAKNILDDVTDKDKKLGAWNITYSKFFENDDEFSAIMKLDNEAQNFVYQKSPLNTLPLAYNKDFESEKNRHRPTYYLKYSGSRDDFAKRDFSFIVQSGYDSYRDTIQSLGKIKQYLYQVDKFITYHTIVKDSTIYKLEYSYTDVKNYTKIDDYSEYGVGVEHTLYGLWEKKDLGLIVEYYKNNINATNIVYQDDLFAGVRVEFNDADSSDIVAGVIRDFDSDKNGYSLEYNTRIKDKFKTKIRYLKNDDLEVFGVDFGWYF
ncbi:MAG TPA: hypothetical protein EYG69_02990 [Campylobacterales bacterium]|nr:hypothetical protein [Campylobacterales bacterium]